MSHDSHLPLLVALTTVLLAPSVSLAADQLIFGKKLLIKNPPSGTTRNKVVHLAKDTSITVGLAGGSGDPQCGGAGGGGGSLRILASAGAGDVTIPLPCTGWTTNSSNNLYKYRDVSGATCKLVLVKHGVLVKAVCGGTQVAIDLNGMMSPVAVVTTLNEQPYCTQFGGTLVHSGSGDTFLRKDAPAPPSCPTTTSTSNTSTSSTETSTSTSSSMTATTILSCFCSDHCDPDYPPGTLVCTASIEDVNNCTDDSQCGSGTFCAGPPQLSCAVLSGCVTACPGGCGAECP